MRQSDGGVILFHGTNLASAVALLNGAPIEIEKALELMHGGSGGPGFYLATDMITALGFAGIKGDIHGDGAVVLAYYLSNKAMVTLMSQGASFSRIRPGKRFTPVGYEFTVPPNAFGTFNGLRETNEIKVGLSELHPQ